MVKKLGVPSNKLPVVVVALVAVIGTITLIRSQAAGPFASGDICEDSPVSGNAFIGHDHANTSCGHYVSFGFNPPTNVSTSLARVATGATGVVDIVNTGVSGDNRLFIVGQSGKIYISNKDNTSVTNTVFLDISSIVRFGGEQGLLGLVFDPNYSQNGYFYVYYTTNTARGTFNGYSIGNNDTVISRFKRHTTNANAADPASELIIMGYDQPETNHNGGGLRFGPDGMLYISSGDGGGGGDNHTQYCSYGNGQCLATHLGKILRIDVRNASTSERYRVPADNPFVSVAGAKPEIWHTGLRNPWRFSFDRKTGEMFIGDVGQNEWEEIDYAAAGQGGKNYGWRCREGNHVYSSTGNTNCTNLSLFTAPIYEYDHGMGCSVTGGYIYRGTAHPEFDGTYIFGDYCTSKLWFLTKGTNNAWSLSQTINTGFPEASLTAFGEDVAGEIYAAIQEGSIYRVDVSH